MTTENELKTERELIAASLISPRLTPDAIDAVIDHTQYHVFLHTTMTVCCIVLKNGFTCVGESACVSPDNFNAKIGRRLAYEKARNKIWELEGYLLRQTLSDNQPTNQATNQ